MQHSPHTEHELVTGWLVHLQLGLITVTMRRFAYGTPGRFARRLLPLLWEAVRGGLLGTRSDPPLSSWPPCMEEQESSTKVKVKNGRGIERWMNWECGVGAGTGTGRSWIGLTNRGVASGPRVSHRRLAHVRGFVVPVGTARRHVLLLRPQHAGLAARLCRRRLLLRRARVRIVMRTATWA